MIRKNFSKILLLIHSLQSASLFCPRPSPRGYRTFAFTGLSGEDLVIYSRKSSTMFQGYGDATRRLIDHMAENLKKKQSTSIFEMLDTLNTSARIIMARYDLKPCLILREPEKKRAYLNQLRQDLKNIVILLRPILVHKIELTEALNETLLPIIKNLIENPKIGASYLHLKLLLIELFNLILQAKTRSINIDLKISHPSIVRCQLETLFEIRPIEVRGKKAKVGQANESELTKSLAFVAKLGTALPLRTPTVMPAVSSPLTTQALESSLVSVEPTPDLPCQAQTEDHFLTTPLNPDNSWDFGIFSDPDLS